MANAIQILDKIERNLKQRGLAGVTRSGVSVVVDNGTNDLTITYVGKDLQKPMGGVGERIDEALVTSPFLGVGVAAPGSIKVKSTADSAGTIADVVDGAKALQVILECFGFANDLVVENGDAGFSETIAGHEHLVGMGS